MNCIQSISRFLKSGSILVLFLSLIASAASLKAQSNTLSESQIRLALKMQEEAWNRGDLEGFMQSYWKNDSLLFIGSKGPTYGWQKTLDNYRESYPDAQAMGKLVFEIKKLTILDQSHAFVVGSWMLQRSQDQPSGYFSLLWKKFGKEWKIIADHSSSE